MVRFSAAILAGGKCQRFGSDKALLRIGDSFILDQIFVKLSSITSQIKIIGEYRKQSAIDKKYFIEDEIKNIGPAGGLYTALDAPDAGVLIIPCDLPFLDLNIIFRIINNHHLDFDATIAVSPKGIEPLIGIYNTRIRSLLKEKIEQKQYALYKFIDNIKSNYVHFKDYGKNSYEFFNINTLSDYKKALYLKAKNQIKTAQMRVEE